MTQFDINAATVSELKAMAYDVLVTLQTAQNNLAALNKAIEYKTSEAAKATEPVTVPCEMDIVEA